jgi:multidrug efflux pump subunit AcrA (membrane-fusion protein)
MVAEAVLQPASSHNAGTAGSLVRIPASALVAADRNHATVFIAVGDRARRREVQVAFIDGNDVAINSGVSAGEQVVSAGAPYLDDNSLIKASAAVP